jgi:glycyl-tRNA synthetase
LSPFYERQELTKLSSVILATTQEQREKLAKEMKEVGKVIFDVPSLGKVEVGHDLLSIEYQTKTENVREFLPHVIEPSFGIGRILFALCEHNFWTRADEGGDEARCVSFMICVSNY